MQKLSSISNKVAPKATMLAGAAFAAGGLTELVHSQRHEAGGDADQRDDEERKRQISGGADHVVAGVALGVDDLRHATRYGRSTGEHRRAACESVRD